MQNTNHSIFILDNTFYAQNQDYFPGRFSCQVEFIYSVMQKAMESHQSTMGIIPLCQPSPNYILTPTKDRKLISQFLSKFKLGENPDFMISSKLFLSIIKKNFLTIQDQKNVNVYLFLGSPVNFVDEVINTLKEVEKTEISLKLILFGEAVDILDKVGNEWINSKILPIKDSDGFRSIYENQNLYGEEFEDDDPSLRAALELSKKEF